MKRLIAILSLFTAVAGLILYLLGPSGELMRDLDSPAYLNVAGMISDGTYFQTLPAERRSIDYLARSPGFPAMLAVGLALGLTPYYVNFILNLVFSCLAILSWYFALGKKVPLWLVIAVFGISMHVQNLHFYLMTEYVVTCVIIAVIACLSRLHRLDSGLIVLSAGLLISLAVLVKPALVVMAPLFLLYALFACRGGPLRNGIFAIVSLMPIASWIVFNYQRTGVMSLTGIRTVRWFVTTFEDCPSNQTDTIELRGAINEFNSNRYQASAEVLQRFWNPYYPEHGELYTGLMNNAYSIGPNVARKRNWTVIEEDEFADLCVGRITSKVPAQQLRFSLYGNLIHLIYWDLLLLAALGAFYLYRTGSDMFRPLLLSVVCHFAQVFFYTLLTLVNVRYYLPTLTVVVFITLLSLTTALLDRKRDAQNAASH